MPFLEKGLRNNSICFYACESADAQKLNNKKNYFTFSFKPNIVFPNMIKFKTKFREVSNSAEEKNSTLRVVVDWGDIRNYCNEESNIIECVQNIVEKASEKIPKPWKRDFRNIKQRNFPIVFINAFSLASISNKFLNQLLQMHKRIVLLTKNENMTSFPGFSLVEELGEPISESLPEEVFEQVIKRNLELVTLSILEKGSMSGYSLIKEISSQFHILLSQGTIYPLLYSLEKSGLLEVKNGIGREKIYALTSKGKQHTQKILAHFRKAYIFLLGLK